MPTAPVLSDPTSGFSAWAPGLSTAAVNNTRVKRPITHPSSCILGCDHAVLFAPLILLLLPLEYLALNHTVDQGTQAIVVPGRRLHDGFNCRLIERSRGLSGGVGKQVASHTAGELIGFFRQDFPQLLDPREGGAIRCDARGIDGEAVFPLTVSLQCCGV